MDLSLIVLVIYASLIGAAIGTASGLIPGIHVNTLAILMAVSMPFIADAMSGFIPAEQFPLLMSSAVVSAAVVHSFTDFVPSVFIGAPDPDEVLSLLPGHRLLREGKGMLAVRSAAFGSLVGASISIILAIPLQYVMLSGLSGILEYVTVPVLIIVISATVLHEKGRARKSWALALITISGALGCMSMVSNSDWSGPTGLGSVLFPLLTGLFGVPPILQSAGSGEIPEQEDGSGGNDLMPGTKGVLAGGVAGWFPGVTATVCATMAAIVSKEDKPERFISMVSSVGTASVVFTLITLSVTGNGRSGTMLVVKDLVGGDLTGLCTPSFAALLLSVALASLMGYIITIWSGRALSSMISGADASRMNKAVLVVICSLVAVMTGVNGLALLAVATAVGMLPYISGVSRISLGGCLMVPVLLMRIGLL
jgi:putative membrane protein